MFIYPSLQWTVVTKQRDTPFRAGRSLVTVGQYLSGQRSASRGKIARLQTPDTGMLGDEWGSTLMHGFKSRLTLPVWGRSSAWKNAVGKQV